MNERGQNVAVLLAALATAALVTWQLVFWNSGGPATDGLARAVRPAEPTVKATEESRSPAAALDDIVFVGDAWTLGVGDPTRQGFARRAAEAVGTDARVIAAPEAGYVAGGFAGDNVTELVRLQPVDQSVRLVVLAAGLSDVNQGVQASAMSTGAMAALSVTSRTWPRADVLVLGPWNVDTTVGPREQALRDAVRGATQEQGATFVNTIRWANEVSIGVDGLTPTGRGHRVAARLTATEVTDVLRG